MKGASRIFSAGRRRDWFRILRDLMAQGVSMREVARECGRDISTVGGWADGTDPKEADARIVLALYAKHCPEKYLIHSREFAIAEPKVDEAKVTLLLRRLVELDMHK